MHGACRMWYGLEGGLEGGRHLLRAVSGHQSGHACGLRGAGRTEPEEWS